jgi:hypothetical protein
VEEDAKGVEENKPCSSPSQPWASLCFPEVQHIMWMLSTKCSTKTRDLTHLLLLAPC